jgi:hypothetical protein
VPSRLLVTGVARSGTTWVAEALGRTTGAVYVHEPDNVDTVPFAVRATARLGHYPVLGAADRAPRALTRLWDTAFGEPASYVRGQQRIALALFGGASIPDRRAVVQPGRGHVTVRLALAARLAVPKSSRREAPHRIVKSVRVPLALDWLSAGWNPAVLVCRRHPLDVVASRLEIGHEHRLDRLSPAARTLARTRFGVPEPPPDDVPACAAWITGFLMSVLDAALRAKPALHVIDHEDLCRDPVGTFRALADELGLDWSAECKAFIEGSNRPGSGYVLRRIASEQPNKWMRRLSPDVARTAARVLAEFPIAERYGAIADLTRGG